MTEPRERTAMERAEKILDWAYAQAAKAMHNGMPNTDDYIVPLHRSALKGAIAAEIEDAQRRTWVEAAELVKEIGPYGDCTTGCFGFTIEEFRARAEKGKV